MQAMTSGFSGMQGSVITTAGCLLRRKQAVYDAGYDQWILWDAGVSYHYGGLLTPEEAEEEDQRISQSRAALETERDAAENVPAETVPAENVPVETVPPENVPPETVPPAGAAR